jgi:low molecular weight phosphotyrosine protein phosphatase
VCTSDFIQFTHILASDESNLQHLNRIKPANATAEIRLWGSYIDNKPIPDPYYGGKVCVDYLSVKIMIYRLHQGGFEKVYEQCVRLSNAFLDEVTKAAS